MGSAERKLVNILLVGQPELNERLAQPQCRSLLQRLSLRYRIKPLDLVSTQEYVAAALKAAGAKDGQEIFSSKVMGAIHQYSRGYPRMINILADNLLLLGYSRGRRNITPSMVKECYDDFQPDGPVLHSRPTKSERGEIKKLVLVQIRRYWKWAAVLFCMMAILAAATTQRGKSILGRLIGLGPPSYQTAPDSIAQNKTLLKKKIVQV